MIHFHHGIPGKRKKKKTTLNHNQNIQAFKEWDIHLLNKKLKKNKKDFFNIHAEKPNTGQENLEQALEKMLGQVIPKAFKNLLCLQVTIGCLKT